MRTWIVLLSLLATSSVNAQWTRRIVAGSDGVVETRLTNQPQDNIILVKPKVGISPRQIIDEARKHKLVEKHKFKHVKWRQFNAPANQSKKETIKRLRESGLFEHVQENHIYQLQDTIPNDPLWPQLWGMTNISAPLLWDEMRDASSVVVAVVDTGMDFNHPDLIANLWTGPNGEHGYTSSNGVTAGGWDDHNHGTHVAGTIGAVGNNLVGVTGVAWKTKIMSMKVLHNGSGNSFDIVNGLEKLVSLRQAGVPIKVSNHSYGGGGIDPFMQDGFKTLAEGDIFAACAAGNAGRNIDVSDFEPAVFPFDNIVSVTACNRAGQLASFSNYGLVRTDIAAPGVEVVSSVRGATYASFSGTSMASPHVAGLAVMLRARNPNCSARQTREILLDPLSQDPSPAFALNNTSARINTEHALNNPRLFEFDFRYNNPPAIAAGNLSLLISNSQPASVLFQALDADNDPIRFGGFSGSLIEGYAGFVSGAIAKNSFSSSISGNQLTVAGDPFAYQLSGDFSISVSDNRGGGASKSGNIEFVFDPSKRRDIPISTWTVRTNADGGFFWVFDVADPVKTNYTYVISFTKGGQANQFFNRTPGPQEQFYFPFKPVDVTIRVFVMDKYLNYKNTDPINFPANAIIPKIILTATNQGNVPFGATFDVSRSVGSDLNYFIYDWNTLAYDLNITNPVQVHQINRASVYLYEILAQSRATGAADRMFVPVFASRFATGFGSSPSPTNPPPATNLVAVTDLRVFLNGQLINLLWSDRSSGEVRYELQWRSRRKGQWPAFALVALPANETDYQLVGRSRYSYQFQVRPVGLSGPPIAWSNLAEIRVP